jgi:hypothetical protein
VLLVLLFGGCLLVAGFALASWLWTRHGGERPSEPSLGPFEFLASGVFLATFLACAINWLLSPAHGISRVGLLCCALLAAVAACVYLVRQARNRGTWLPLRAAMTMQRPRLRVLHMVAILTPVLLWLGYMTWRGTLTPVLSHDANSYHLPRAVDIVRTGTWRYLPVEDFRLSWFPSDYEMVLADVIALSGGQVATQFVAVGHYAIALLLCIAYAERRWKGGAQMLLAPLVWAGTPLALLHAGGQKNDLLAMISTLAAALWGAKWLVRGGWASLFLALAAVALSAGTKPLGVVVGPALVLAGLPFGLVARVRGSFTSARTYLLFLSIGAALFYFGGITPLLEHLVRRADGPAGGLSSGDLYALNISPGYGNLSNFWEYPTLLFLRPFSQFEGGVWVPWQDKYWFWPGYEIYFSHFGVLVSCLVCLIPLRLLLKHQTDASPDVRRERAVTWAFFLLLALSIVQIRYRTDGFFCGHSRYLFFLPLVVVDAGFLSLLFALRRQALAETGAGVALVGAALLFVVQAFTVAERDRFAPYDYVMGLAEHPDDRLPYFNKGVPRAAQVIDATAGPSDRVAIDGGFGAWVFPAYGARLTRPVDIIPVDREGRERVLASADWVAVDRYWAIAWGAPGMNDMGVALDLIDKGQPTRPDVEAFENLSRDTRFALVYSQARRGQFVFRRVTAAP